MLFDIFLTVFLVALNGFFVAAEFAIVKIRGSQLEILVQSGARGAKTARTIVSHLDAYLSATQLGITLASLALGWIGENVVMRLIFNIFAFAGINLPVELGHSIALPTAFILITFLHIVFGELAPKSLAIQRTEPVTLVIAFPLRVFYLIFKPFIWFLNGVANRLLSMVGIAPANEYEIHSAEELRYLLEQGKETGAINSSEHELIQNVFHFAERTVKQVMVPRTHITALDIAISTDTLLSKVIEEGYSRMPVFQGGIDNIVGVVYAKDLLTLSKHSDLIIINDILRPAYFVPETKPINTLLREFQRQHLQMAIVVDEFGGTAGIVTIEDILEEIVGEIQDEYDEEKPVVERINDTEFIVAATSAISDANEFLPKNLPESEDYDTVGGLVNLVFEKIPEIGEKTISGGYEFTVLKKSKRSVQSIRLTVVDEDSDNEEDEE